MAPDAYEISVEEFERRHAQASAGGKWRWYWPDVEPEDWNHALQGLEAVTRAVLAWEVGEFGGMPASTALSVAAYTSGMGPLIGSWIERGQVRAADDVAALFALHLDHNRRRMTMLGEVARAVLDRLAEAGIAATLLKGMDTAYRYFPDPAARPLSDIDLLVTRAEHDPACAVLVAAGYAKIGEAFKETSWALAGGRQVPRSLLLVHAEDFWSIDLHHTIDQKPVRGAPMTRLARIVDSYCVPGWPLDPRHRVLAQPALLLQLAAHIGAAMQVNPSLLRLTELVLVIRADRTADKLDWPAFLALARASRSLGLAYPGLSLAEKLAPGTVPGEVIEACARAAPRRVRRLVAEMTPASAQRLERLSVRAHYMWARGPVDLAWQVAADLWPDRPLPQLAARYGRLVGKTFAGAYIR
jgi:hypothetical protein